MHAASLFLLVLLVAVPAHAQEGGSQWNDSDTVQLPGDAATYPGDLTVPDQEEGDEGDGGDGDGSGGSGGSGGGDVIIFEEPGAGGSGSSSGGSGGGGGSSGASGGSSDDTESLLETLLIGGGVSGTGGASAGVAGTGGGGSGLSAEGGVYIDGKKVREALKGKGVLRVTLRGFTGEGALSGSDFGLVGASAILKNPALESAFISLSRFEIAYRSQGYLLGVIPISFRVRLEVNPAESTLAERVKVKFPWYSFFLRKFVSKEGLAQDIDAIVTRQADPSLDRGAVQAQIFTDVAILLQGRVDTVEGTVEQSS